MTPQERFYHLLGNAPIYLMRPIHVAEVIELAQSGEVDVNLEVIRQIGTDYQINHGTPLTYICNFFPGRTSIINALLAGGADPNLQLDGGSHTPLVGLINELERHRNPTNDFIVSSIEQLLLANADPNTDSLGRTALCEAVRINNYGVVSLLLSVDADPSILGLSDEGDFRYPIEIAFERMYDHDRTPGKVQSLKRIIALLMVRGSPLIRQEVLDHFANGNDDRFDINQEKIAQGLRFANLLADEREKKEAVEYDVFYHSLARLPNRTMRDLPDDALNNIQSFLVPTPRTIPHAVMRSALASRPAASQIEFDEKEESEPELIFEYKEDHNNLD